MYYEGCGNGEIIETNRKRHYENSKHDDLLSFSSWVPTQNFTRVDM